MRHSVYYCSVLITEVSLQRFYNKASQLVVEIQSFVLSSSLADISSTASFTHKAVKGPPPSVCLNSLY